MKWILVFSVLIADWMIIEKMREGFWLWIFVDGFFSINNFIKKDFAQSVVFAFYAFMGIYGLFCWH